MWGASGSHRINVRLHRGAISILGAATGREPGVVPADDAALQVQDIVMAGGGEQTGGLLAAAAALAKHHERAVPGQLLYAAGQLHQGNMDGVGDPDLLEFPCFTHIDKERPLLEQFFGFVGSDLRWGLRG